MSAHAVFSDIFTLNTVETMNQQLESLFLIQQKNWSVCSSCNNEIVKNTCIFVIYITCQNLGHSLFENCVCDAILPSSRALFCDMCQHYSGVVSVLQHFVTQSWFYSFKKILHDISNFYIALCKATGIWEPSLLCNLDRFITPFQLNDPCIGRGPEKLSNAK